jgi:hypothetical protein
MDDILKPSNFVQIFDSELDFELFCGKGSIEDLNSMLEYFEEDEMYEHCAVILKIIKSRHGNCSV